MFKYGLYKLGQYLVNRLPLAVCYKLAMMISDAQYYFSFRDRRAVENNLRAILPFAPNINILTREVFRNFGKYLTEFFRMAKTVDAQYVKERVKVENLSYIDEVLAKGKGGILITAHIGNWELGGSFLSALGYPIMAIALAHKERPVNDLFNQQRQVRGMTVIPTQHAIRRSIQHLKSNKLIALLVDRDFSHNGEVMDFLGKRVMIPKGAAIFSLKTQAPLIPVFILRNHDDTFTLSMGKPILPLEESCGHDSDEHTMLLNLMRKYTAVVEEKIRQYPTQWLMFRKFWVEDSIK